MPIIADEESGRATLGKSASWSQILPPIVLSRGGRVSFDTSHLRRRKTTAATSNSGDSDQPQLRIQVTLHKALRWQLSSPGSNQVTRGGPHPRPTLTRNRQKHSYKDVEGVGESFVARSSDCGDHNRRKRQRKDSLKSGVGQHSSFVVRLKGSSKGSEKGAADEEEMTWFKGCSRHQRDSPPTHHKQPKGGVGMGVGGSREEALRSQSSSALFEPNSAQGGLSGSIPNNLWDLKSPKHGAKQQCCAKQCRKGGRKEDRSKLYAVSCPDVAQRALLLFHPPPHQQPIPPHPQPESLILLPPPEGYRNRVGGHQLHCPLSQSRLYAVPPPLMHPQEYSPPNQTRQYVMIPPTKPVQPPVFQVQPQSLDLISSVCPASAASYKLIPPPSAYQSPPYLPPEELDSIFPAFVIPENIFEVHLLRDQRGLGLSVSGGRDSDDKYPGLIRIKKVFPMSPASDSGRIAPWDVILQANGVPLTGMTNHEALSVLRTTPPQTILILCRPPPCTPGFMDPSPVPQLNQQGKSKSLCNLGEGDQLSYQHMGEFEVILDKVQGSLGFTLKQEDSSVLGHYVKALVKEPALSDGRIQPGDRIISVNDKDLSEMSHAETILYLRQCSTRVKLKLWRDPSPTPCSPLSPTDKKLKPLRQEAIDMLNDLALRKQGEGQGKHSLPSSITTSGRTLRSHKHSDPNGPATLPRIRHNKIPGLTPSPQVLSAALSRFAPTAAPTNELKAEKSSHTIPTKYEGGRGGEEEEEERSCGSGESSPMGSTSKSNPYRAYKDLRSDSYLDKISSLEEDGGDVDRGGAVQNHSRLSLPNDESHIPQHPFRSGQPKYQSAILPSKGGIKGEVCSDLRKSFGAGIKFHASPQPTLEDTTASASAAQQGGGVGVLSNAGDKLLGSPKSSQKNSSTSLLKWKGVLLEEEDEGEESIGQKCDGVGGKGESYRRSPDGREFRECDVEISGTTEESGKQIITVQLNRRWCSRLGFSLQGKEGNTFISAIYPDSVAAKDGRLRVGDQLIMVNEERTDNLETCEIIDKMRKTRGIISMTLVRVGNNGTEEGGSDTDVLR